MSQIVKNSGEGIVFAALQKMAQNAPEQAPAPENSDGQPEKPKDEFTIPESNMAMLMAQIEKLNKVAAKLKVDPVKVEIIGTKILTQSRGEGLEPLKIPANVVKIIGQAPKLNGWLLAARILHTPEGNIIKATPAAKDLPTDYRNTPPICEYCKTNRDRRDTFLVINEASGEVKQIGRNCLKDFLGHPNPEMYARWAEMLGDLYGDAEALERSEDRGTGSGGARTYVIDQFLETVAAMRRSFGWISRSLAREKEQRGEGTRATADEAMSYLSNAKAANDIADEARKRGKPLEFKPEDKELIGKALEWIRGIKESKDANQNLSDYLWNLAVASTSTVTDKTAGIVASLLSAYERANSGLPANTTSGEAAKGFVGQPNKSITLKGKLLMAKPIQSYRGSSTLFGVQDESGNVVKWFDNSGAMSPYKPGDEVMVTGIVKAHKSYMGKPETELAGARFIDQGEFDKIRAEEAVAADAAKAGEPSIGVAAPQVEYKPGQKVDNLELTLVDLKHIPATQFGSSTLHTFLDATGRQFKWFASKEELEVGKKYKIKATVKGEQEYNGVKSVMLTRVSVISVGGQQAVTTKDINLKKKEVNNLWSQMNTLNEQIRQQEGEILKIYWEMKKTKPIARQEMSRLDEAIGWLQDNIAHAKTDGPAFLPKNLDSIDWEAKSYLQQFERPFTPQEFIDKATPHWTGIQTLKTELGDLIEQRDQLQDEYYKLRGSWQTRDKAMEVGAKLTPINLKIDEIKRKYPDLINYDMREFEKSRQIMERAQQAHQSGAAEFGEVPGGALNYMETKYRRPLSNEEFVQRAEEIIRNSLEYKQLAAPFLAKAAQLEQELKPVKEQYDLKEEELQELESMKGKAKKAQAQSWVLENCKFASIES